MLTAERFWLRLRLLWRRIVARRDMERELSDELADHLDRQTAAHRATGLAEVEARRAARRALRGVELPREQCRAAWQTRALDQLLQDLRYGARALRRSPVWSGVAILSLAIGIGANTTLWSVIDTVMRRELPVRAPERLLLLGWTAAGFPDHYADDLEGDCDDHGGVRCLVFSSAAYDRLRQGNTVFTSLFAFASNEPDVNLGVRGAAEDVPAQAVSGSYFGSLGVVPALGRALDPSDDTAAAPRAVVVSHEFWQDRLGGDPRALGETLIVDGTPATVVGVAPPGFTGMRPGTTPALWMPLALLADLSLRHEAEDLTNPRTWWLSIGGRLAPGASPVAARVQMAALFRQSLSAAGGLTEIGPQAVSGASGAAGAAGAAAAAATTAATAATAAAAAPPALIVRSAARGLDDLRQQFSTPLLLLAAMVGLVLLITCANVAGLLLAKTQSRRSELALRLSLGAGRLRLVRQMLTESVLLALIGGAASLWVAGWVRAPLWNLLIGSPAPGSLERPQGGLTAGLPLDHGLWLLTAGLALGSGLIFGLVPALRAGSGSLRPDPSPAAGRGATERRFVAGKIMVGAQMAFSLVLLVGAGLFARTLERLHAVDLGFDAQRLVSFRVRPGLSGLAGPRLTAYYQELERRLAALPGVETVGLSLQGPVAAGSSTGQAEIAGITTPGKRFPFVRQRVDPAYFATLGLRPLQGRLLEERDGGTAPHVAVVNERLVRDQLHGANPLGRVLSFGPHTPPVEIVGVVRSLRTGHLRDDPPGAIYVPYVQTPQVPAFMTYLVRSRGEPRSIMAAIRSAALQLDAAIPVASLRTESEVIDRSLRIERTFATLSAAFGAVAVLLACLGLYGTISYLVARRRHEIGVRMALGARRAAILGGVIRETLWLTAGGVAAGLPAAWLGLRILAHQLYGVGVHDSLAYGLAIVPLLAAALLAGWLPARQAASVDPTVALRAE